MVKEQASELLRAALQSPKWTPQVLGLSGVTDPYQPIERDKKLTRHCLEVVAEFRNPVLVITKNALVTRDIDLFTELAAYGAAAVFVSVTTLDTQLARVMEPRTATPKRRLTAIRALSQAGIPVGVLIAPVIPGLNDHEIPEIIAQSVDSGAQFAGYVSLRLPHAVAGLFENWLTLHFPNRASKVLSQVRQLHGGKLCGTNFGSRMKGKGVIADHISALFQMSVNRAGIGHWHPKLSTSSFRRPGETQMSLFG
jgi:DNA repair photolyase